ncbi:2-dehydropantoate 2-reductase [Faecalicatena acetigenes]|uniref:2-dehydropantoate 2-reductase n=1 Tax=Faecalicatena acetigenes TaxID=2981790 RepID=A0ABT2TC28_9FIRM|nr:MULTISPECIES: 2-dehydropantoate 2-reductase [Lachnospiraceae]MCU6747833.1 2-dehydropantoate 2-reductase [Faecalicatena acetigenes]SCI12272.1 2-dehydropantoate 2-reductase [uncultured Clostridium sp.]
MEINSVALIGLGAMGSFFAPRLEACLGKDKFCVIAEGERKKRLEEQGITVNGVVHRFRILPPKEGKRVDLVIMAVKDTSLEQAIQDIRQFVGEDTQILCVMNGVDSEEKLAYEYGWEHVLYSYMRVSIVMKDGKTEFNPYSGKVYFGEKENEEPYTQRVQAIARLFEKSDIPFQIQKDMLHGIWHKFACNIGENLPCALLGIPFGSLIKSEPADEIRMAAMREVQQIALKKGIILTDEQLNRQKEALYRIPFYNKPSTLQDLENKRKTEIEMFAGAVVRMGKETGVDTPICWMLLKAIQVLEEKNIGLLEENR